MYGLKSTNGQQEGLARKRAGFMMNSPCIAQHMSLRCPNTKEHKVHEHVILVDGRARAAQVYPEKLCRAVCEGLVEQIKAVQRGQFISAEINNNNLSD